MDINGIMKNKITKKSTIRDVMQVLGTDLLRQGFNNNIHVAATMGSIKDTDKVIITDTRFPNELEAVKSKGGITIRVNRPCNICGGSGYHKMSCPVSKSGEHCSETALDNAEFDYIIENEGELVDLVSKVRKIMLKENLWQEKQ